MSIPQVMAICYEASFLTVFYCFYLYLLYFKMSAAQSPLWGEGAGYKINKQPMKRLYENQTHLQGILQTKIAIICT